MDFVRAEWDNISKVFGINVSDDNDDSVVESLLSPRYWHYWRYLVEGPSHLVVPRMWGWLAYSSATKKKVALAQVRMVIVVNGVERELSNCLR